MAAETATTPTATSTATIIGGRATVVGGRAGSAAEADQAEGAGVAAPPAVWAQ